MKTNTEFLKLQAWCDTILTFLSSTPYRSDISDNILIFEDCCRKGTLRQMRVFAGDLNEMVGGSTRPEYLSKLNRILMEKFGEDLSSRMAKRMAGVLKRGKIRNDEEFVRVNEWIDHLLWDKDNPDAEQQIEQYNQLLRDYEERAARHLRKKQS